MEGGGRKVWEMERAEVEGDDDRYIGLGKGGRWKEREGTREVMLVSG